MSEEPVDQKIKRTGTIQQPHHYETYLRALAKQAFDDSRRTPTPVNTRALAYVCDVITDAANRLSVAITEDFKNVIP